MEKQHIHPVKNMTFKQKLSQLEKIIASINDVTGKKQQLSSLTKLYSQQLLPFLPSEFFDHKIQTRKDREIRILLPGCGEYIGAIDAICCLSLLSPAHIVAFDMYLDMHTMDLYEELMKLFYEHIDGMTQFHDWDIYNFSTDSQADLVIMRNPSPHLQNAKVFIRLINAVKTDGIFAITSLSLKEASYIRDILHQEFIKPHISILHEQAVFVDGFLMNDRYIMVGKKI